MLLSPCNTYTPITAALTNMPHVQAKCAAGFMCVGKRMGASEPEHVVRALRQKKALKPLRFSKWAQGRPLELALMCSVQRRLQNTPGAKRPPCSGRELLVHAYRVTCAQHFELLRSFQGRTHFFCSEVLPRASEDGYACPGSFRPHCLRCPRSLHCRCFCSTHAFAAAS